MSLIGALTHLGEVPFEKKQWFRSVLAYTLGGCVSATLVGAALGVLGRWLGVHALGIPALWVICVLGLTLAAREWGWIRFPLPQRRRQTEKVWAHQFGFVIASALWGFDIGLGFATRISTGGFWILTAVAVALGDPAYGGLLLLMYWFGRALTVWAAPALITRGSDAHELLDAIEAEGLVTHRIAGLGLVWSAAVAIAFTLQTQ